MQILFVCSGRGKISPFVREQEISLNKEEVKVDYFRINGRGLFGYIKNYPFLIKKIDSGNYDLIHAHYGLSGLLSSLQKKLPTVVTFHGSDVNVKKNRFFSLLASRLAQHNIVVHKRLAKLLYLTNNYSVIPCGVDLDNFYVIKKEKARSLLNFDLNSYYILFSSSFDKSVKNYPLAKEAVEKVDMPVELIELKNKSRQEVNLLMNACDLLLMTSFSEGSPQVVKEALACDIPIVSTDVGDIKELIESLNNCYITSYKPKEVAEKIELVLKKEGKTNGRSIIKKFELQSVAKSVKTTYKKVLNIPYAS